MVDASIEGKTSLFGVPIKVSVSTSALIGIVIAATIKYREVVDRIGLFIGSFEFLHLTIAVLLILCSIQTYILLLEPKVERNRKIFAKIIRWIAVLTFCTAVAVLAFTGFLKLSDFASERFSPIVVRLLVDRAYYSQQYEELKRLIESGVKEKADDSQVILDYVTDSSELLKKLESVNNTSDDIVLIHSPHFAGLLDGKTIDLQESEATLFLTLSPVTPADVRKNQNLISIAPSSEEVVSLIARDILATKPERVIAISERAPVYTAAARILASFVSGQNRITYEEKHDGSSFSSEQSSELYLAVLSDGPNTSVASIPFKRGVHYGEIQRSKIFSPLYNYSEVLTEFSIGVNGENLTALEMQVALSIIMVAIADNRVGLNPDYIEEVLFDLETKHLWFDQKGQIGFHYDTGELTRGTYQ